MGGKGGQWAFFAQPARVTRVTRVTRMAYSTSLWLMAQPARSLSIKQPPTDSKVGSSMLAKVCTQKNCNVADYSWLIFKDNSIHQAVIATLMA